MSNKLSASCVKFCYKISRPYTNRSTWTLIEDQKSYKTKSNLTFIYTLLIEVQKISTVMKIGGCEVKTDRATDHSYLIKVCDEETKNHKECDSDVDSPFMPEIPNSKYYSVQSYLTYLFVQDKSVDFLATTKDEVIST